MFSISRFAVEGIECGLLTDQGSPRFTYSTVSDEKDTIIDRASISVGNYTIENAKPTGERYHGPELMPYSSYEAKLTVWDNHGNVDSKVLTFETGKMGDSFKGSWITNGNYTFKEKGISPVPMTFRKKLSFSKPVKRARIFATAMGIYELYLNEKKVGREYFAPGFTSYKSQLQYQTYDVTEQLKENNELIAYVAGGWAVGAFVFTRVNRVTANRQALLLEIRVEYEDGTNEVIATDSSWQVSMVGPFKMADLYDGETFDSNSIQIDEKSWNQASVENLKINPKLIASYGQPVTRHERIKAVASWKNDDGSTTYDFGQNFAGVVELYVKNGTKGQKIIVKHAELLNPDKSLNTKFLRSAKATATYVCREGSQIYAPSFTYMGFRYANVSGIPQSEVEVTAIATYSDIEQTGAFSCSDELINQLQSNIVWSSKSNFFDIPTDCPQRDERMGWTGDIAVFAPTACYNFDMTRFLKKWLKDVKSEQLPTGGIPNTVPVQGYGFPATMPKMAIDWWGDACLLVPWSIYQSTGDISVLEDMYDTMKKYVDACKRWAGLFSFGDNRYIWNTPSVIHFGDWVAPDVPKMSQWQQRAKWTATASLKNTSGILSKVAGILNNTADAKYYEKLSQNVAKAYVKKFTDQNGKLNEEFQTGYVLPIYMDMFDEEDIKNKAADNLAKLVKSNDYCIGTGFPGTPYILFALADNGQADTAFKMLTNTKCPSWLYEVKQGATTIWERWDGLDEKGQCPIGDDGTDIMISYNHYASGAVGDFLYKRVAGIEAITPGYETFRVKPIIGGGLTWAKGTVRTPFGDIKASWNISNNVFELSVSVPVGCQCMVCMPDNEEKTIGSGEYIFTCQC